jgi:hypothetical protein
MLLMSLACDAIALGSNQVEVEVENPMRSNAYMRDTVNIFYIRKIMKSIRCLENLCETLRLLNVFTK